MPAPPPTGPLVTRGTLVTDLRALGVRPGVAGEEPVLSAMGPARRGRVARP
ncbi:hypothetical protein ACWFRM_15810 [Streptomyces sp. NPDC055144]